MSSLTSTFLMSSTVISFIPLLLKKTEIAFSSVFSLFSSIIPAWLKNCKTDLKLSNQEKLNFALFCLNNEEGLSISEDKIKNVLVSYFGNDLEFKNENILDLNTQEIIAKYYPKKKKYTYTDVTLDYPDTSLTLLSYGDYKEEKNTFEVYRQYLFVDASYNIYSTYQDYINKTNSLGVYDVSTTNGVLTSSIVNNYIDILPVVTYSFKKEQNRYVLVSIN